MAESAPPLRHLSDRLRISRTWARAASNPCDVSTTKSARRRFSASGICLARMACELVLGHAGPLESARRAACRPAPRPPPPRRSACRRRSRTAAERRAPRPCAPLARASARKRSSACAHQRMHDVPPAACMAAASPSTRWPSLSRSTLPLAVVPGNAASISGRRLAFIEPMHGGIGVVHRHALLGEHFRRGGFSHAERAGQSEDEHVTVAQIFRSRPTATFVSAAENASSGNSGRPRMVK